MVAVQHLADSRRAPLDVATARARVEALQHELPPTLLAARPEQLRRLARTSLDAERAALRRRSKVGVEPALDIGAAEAAIDAHAAVRAARQGLSDTGAEGQRWLAIGNVWGLVGLAGAAALVLKAGYEPMASPVAFTVVGGAAGPLATAVLALTRRSVASMRLASTLTAWADALRVTGFETMGELWARRVAHRAWARRSDEAAVATAVARDARAAWHRVVGPRRHPREAPAIVEQLAQLRVAQLDLFEALVAAHLRRVEAAASMPASDVVPFAITWATGEPVVGEPRSRRPLSFRFWRR